MNYKQIWLFVGACLMLLRQQLVAADCSSPLTSFCDPRCNGKCVFTYDQNSCCDCVQVYSSANHFFWIQDRTNSGLPNLQIRCGATCPSGYWPQVKATGSGPNTCSTCTYPCQTCTNFGNTNCVTCVANAYLQGSTICWQLNVTDNNAASRPYDANPCMPPYYGLYPTKGCAPCPAGCQLCNLQLDIEMPTGYTRAGYSWSYPCPDNGLCAYALKCYSCDTTSYALEEYTCISKNRCRKYSLYNSTTSGFNAAYCYCKPGFYLSGTTSCSICHVSCKTCNGPLSTNCIYCHNGATLNTGTSLCQANSTYAYIKKWAGAISSSGSETVTPTIVGGSGTPLSGPTIACDSANYYFGYYGYDNSNSASYFGKASLRIVSTSSVINTPHYGIHFRAKFLFIDDWVDGMWVVFQESGVEQYSYRYAMQNIIGEYFCGRASFDHHDLIDFSFAHTRTNNVDLTIQVPYTGFAWGIREVILGVLKCDISCTSCNGPTEYDCLACGAHQVLVNGDCVCDVDTGWFNDTYASTPGCYQNCTGGNYSNPVTRTCTPDCSIVTYLFQQIDPTTFKRSCQVNCSAGFWKYTSNMSCVDDCYNPSLADNVNYYNFDGIDKVCYQNCPAGYYGDPYSHYCVTNCPLTPSTSDNANRSYYVQGKICVLYCTGSTWAFSPNRTCMPSCPLGYYKTTITVSSTAYPVCEDICSVTLSGDHLLADNTTGSCVDYCPAGGYADYTLKLCLANCNISSFKQVIVVSGNTVRSCETQCDSAGNNLYGNWDTGKCVVAASCPLNTYGDSHTTYCQANCTDSAEYGDNFTRLCQTVCYNSSFKQNYTKRCVKTCPISNFQGNPEFGDHIYQGDFCVLACISNTYADSQANRQCVYSCTATPVSTFGQNNVCVHNCSSTTWGDPNQNRTCTTSCTWVSAGTKSYGENQTRLCVSTCPDTTFGIVVGGVPICTYVCQARTTGMFGNPDTNLCVEKCPVPYYGDQINNRSCVTECPDTYFAQNTTAAGVISDIRICVQTCDYGWADNLTRMCATSSAGCSAGLFAHESNHKCVLPINCTGFGDPLTRTCMPTCFSNSSLRYFGDPSTKMCVLECPEVPDYYGDNHTSQCGYTCFSSTLEVRDPQYYRRCVTDCSRTPLALFFDLAAGLCVTIRNCTAGTFADNSTNKCQADCQGSLLQYADPVTRQCISQCEMGWYGYNFTANNGSCVQRCPLDLWADNLTVLCTSRCSPLTYGLNYTDTSVTPNVNYGICKSECPSLQYARDTDNICVPNCEDGLWGNNDTNRCVTSPYDCPNGTYADNGTHMCVLSVHCSIIGGIQHVADNISRECLPQCPPQTVVYNWADMAKLLCVAICPHGYYGFNSSLECQTECRASSSSPWVNQFADPQNQICVSICSAYPIPTFGETTTYTCVQARYCPGETWAEIEVSVRRCIYYCPNVSSTNPQKYADNMTKSCVTTCPTYFYGDLQRGFGMCVDVCPSTNQTTPQLQFSDNYTKTCVTVCPVNQSTFGDVLSLRCVLTCPLTYFAQEVPVRHCVTTCSTGSWGNKVRRFCETSPSNCQTINGSHYYADNHSHLCVDTCPSSPNYWGENSTWLCNIDCITGFKFNDTRVCIDICPASLDGDGSFSDQGMCYFTCMTVGYYRDPQNNRSCQPLCSFSPTQYYGDQTTWKCVMYCPAYPVYYYAYDTDRICRTDCPSTWMRDRSTRRCVSTCPNDTFFEVSSDQCVSRCPADISGVLYYGDPNLAIPKCVIATSCTNGFYGDAHVGLCVSTCTDSQWKYGKQCITHCPDGYYGNYATGFCVTPLNCPLNNYAENYTRTCVNICNGSFADTSLKVCVDICPTNYFADPVTRLCSTTCTNTTSVTLHRDFTDQTCVSSCSEYQYLNPLNNTCEDQCNSPYFEDRTTQTCVTVCPSVPPLFADTHTRKCSEECENTTSEFKYIPERTCRPDCPTGYFRENITRFCVTECFNVTFADDNRGYCVFNCSPRYSLDDPINVCTALCPLPYYRDPTTFTCVTDCPSSPVQLFKATVGNDNYCHANCPGSQYRDFSTFSCVDLCPPNPPTYADSSTGNCVTVCPSTPVDLYANLQTRVCTPRCPDGMYAENITRTCVYKCPNKTDLYGDGTLSIPYCVHLCSPGLYADSYTLTCAGSCNTLPQTYGFDNTTTRICLASCLYPYIADNTSFTCVLYCSSTDRPYLDKASKSCVSQCSSLVYQFSYMPLNQIINGTCETFCPSGFFAQLNISHCVRKCPDGFYGDITNNTCYPNCTLANNKFADSTTNMCVSTCPYSSTYDSYADLFSRKCVVNCPLDKFTVKDTNTRRCEPNCTRSDEYIDYTSGYGKCTRSCPSTPLRFADNSSQVCVTQCSLYSQMFGYIPTRICVLQCPVSGLYANSQNRLCVSALNCPANQYGLDPERICISVCPVSRNLYADLLLKMCASGCSGSNYADPSTQTCVGTCPTVPSLYGILPNKICLQFCPNGKYADNQTRKCDTFCSQYPLQQFADNSTNMCVDVCPSSPNYFSENVTFTCVFTCPSPMFADYSTRKCVNYCPLGHNQTFADPISKQCVFVCPTGSFMQNSTGTCVTNCTEGFADPQTKFCIALCPNYYYGHLLTRECLSICPNASLQLYAEDNTNMCESSCLLIYDTFKDSTTKRCVKICPIQHGLYAQPLNRVCTDTCLRSPMQFADNLTRSCVTTCPYYPATFGDTNSLICVENCPNATYSDNSSRRCVSPCPSTPNDTYGDNTTWSCVSYCPSQPYLWADNYSRTCVPICPSTPDFYADNNTGKCVYYCSQGTFADLTTRMCVETCPSPYYGRPATFRCVTGCEAGEFADHLLRLCVSKCSLDPIFYGNPDTNNCTEECPNTTYSFGNPLTQQCVKYQPNGTSGCPDYYYSDNLTRLCVKKCPLTRDTYGDNSTWKCVSRCPGGSVNTFSDNSTMMCVSTCPVYPEYYAEPYSRRCVPLCLIATLTYSGSFADNSTRHCVEQCPSSPDYFSDNSTRRCVFYCPADPLTYADNQTRRCVTTCPDVPDIYGDNKTRRCVPVCPEEEATYADYTTRMCVKVCPASALLFGNNDTNRCVPYMGCPNNSFADNASRLCVQKCPEYPDTYGDHSTKRCVATCPSIPDLYADPFSQQCVDRCPDGTYAENNTRRCMPYCPPNLVNYADNVTNRCMDICPESNATYGDNSTQKCVPQCPHTPFTYADNITRTCLTICQNISNGTIEGGYAENYTRVCVRMCPGLSYGNPLTRYCVRYCPPQYYAYTVTNMCVTDCPFPFFADNSTWRCVPTCPVSQLFFGQNINRTCTPFCPDGTYADSSSQQCVPQCPGPTHDTYAYEPIRTCVNECPLPLFAYPVTWVCRPDCLDPYYQNITDHRCYKCPDECAVCTYPQNCIVCVPNHYLYSGMCLESCPTFPVITYANPNGHCGTAFQCTSGYFALNITKSCVQNCPSGFYKNSSLQACDACLAGCSYCVNSLQCITCNTAIALWDANKCYIYCSQLRKYYTDIGCVSTCPTGYYLELVNCLACSSLCKSCVVQPENCLTCADGYYLSNNLCVSTCPDNTKAVLEGSKLYCKSCSETDCTTTPLTYQVTQYVQDYQYKFRVKFSEQVNITQQIDQVIRIRQKTVNRRLMQVTYTYLDYTITDYGNGEYVIALNTFDTRDNTDMEFSFEIINPEAIVSPSGQFPAQTRSTVVIPSSKFYSVADYNVHLANYAGVVCVVAVILLFLTFFANQSIWMPVVDFFQLLFALLFVTVSMPPNPTYVISKSKILILSFLPNMFEKALPKAQYQTTITSTMFTFFGDMIFLRTMGFLFTIVLVLLLVFGVMALLWKKGKWKGAKQFCKDYLREVLPKRDLHGYIYLFFLPILVISFMKMRSYKSTLAIQGFSIFSSLLFVGVAIIVPIYFAYKIYRLVRDYPTTFEMLKKAYEYITTREAVLDQNSIYFFTNQNNEVDLKEIARPRVNQLRILPYEIQTRFGVTELSLPLVQYLFKFLIAFFLAVAYDKGAAQLFLLLLATMMNLLYFSVIKPYYHVKHQQYNNYLSIHNMAIYCIIIAVMIILEMRNTAFTYDQRVIIGNLIAAVVVYAITVNTGYFMWRAYQWYHDHVWRPFVFSDLFKENYTLQYWDYKKQYEEVDKANKKKSGNREQFLNAIKLENKLDGLQSMVKKDPNSSVMSNLKPQQKQKQKHMNLRPNRNEQLKKMITNMFQTFNDEKQKSHKSLRSSERLSKQQRNKVRDTIFGEKDHKPKNQLYEPMKIEEKEEEHDEARSKDEQGQEQETEYQYEYIDEEYPEGTDMQEILKGCKKGDIVMH